MPDNSDRLNTTNSLDIPGNISKHIGTGKHAQAAIVWETIIASFVVGCLLTIILLVAAQLKIIAVSIEDIKILWSTIFVPIITVSLGYIFGKGAQ